MSVSLEFDKAYKEAMSTAACSEEDPKAIASLLPRILSDNDISTADKMFSSGMFQKNALPEAYTLFNLQNIPEKTQLQWLNIMGGRFVPAQADTVKDASAITASIGRIGFSFPQWRFVSQRFNEAALVEAYGMKRVQRDTDVKNPSLSPADPNRDEFGAGYIFVKDNIYIEYRRAYLLCADLSSDKPSALIIRNSSYFFGRDRLPAPALVSFENFEQKNLQNLTIDSVNSSFISWEDVLSHDADDEKISRLKKLIERLDEFDIDLGNWLQTDGYQKLYTVMEEGVKRNSEKGEALKPVFYLSSVGHKSLPWCPEISIPATASTLPYLQPDADMPVEISRIFDPSKKLVLLSGEQGDFPVKPVL